MNFSKKPEVEKKIDNENIMLVWWNSGVGYSNQYLKVKRIETRKDAICLCESLTRNELSKDSAYDNLHNFCNDFSKHRNYEIESYLHKISEDYTYRIAEGCPFSNFSWFD